MPKVEMVVPKMEVEHIHDFRFNDHDMYRLVKALTKGAIIVTLIYLGGDTARQVIVNGLR